jgi:hypothetical protein
MYYPGICLVNLREITIKLGQFCYQSWLISETDLREMGCEDGRWMELAQDRVQWRALVLETLNLRVPLPDSQYT